MASEIRASEIWGFIEYKRKIKNLWICVRRFFVCRGVGLKPFPKMEKPRFMRPRSLFPKMEKPLM